MNNAVQEQMMHQTLWLFTMVDKWRQANQHSFTVNLVALYAVTRYL